MPQAQYGYPQQPGGYAPPAPPQPYPYPYPGPPSPYYQPPPVGHTYPGGVFYGQPPAPKNDAAIASLIAAISSIGGLVLTVGLLAPLSLIASIVAIILGVKGKKAVDEGRTTKDRDVAIGGIWTGVAGIVLSVVAIAGWVVFIVWISGDAASDPGDLAGLLAPSAR
ncbi:MAG: hypothetical protein WAO61_07570 [Solirubrobacterales bacterium]